MHSLLAGTLSPCCLSLPLSASGTVAWEPPLPAQAWKTQDRWEAGEAGAVGRPWGRLAAHLSLCHFASDSSPSTHHVNTGRTGMQTQRHAVIAA